MCDKYLETDCNGTYFTENMNYFSQLSEVSVWHVYSTHVYKLSFYLICYTTFQNHLGSLCSKNCKKVTIEIRYVEIFYFHIILFSTHKIRKYGT